MVGWLRGVQKGAMSLPCAALSPRESISSLSTTPLLPPPSFSDDARREEREREREGGGGGGGGGQGFSEKVEILKILKRWRGSG